jgi:hypothetical protein
MKRQTQTQVPEGRPYGSPGVEQHAAKPRGRTVVRATESRRDDHKGDAPTNLSPEKFSRRK